MRKIDLKNEKNFQNNKVSSSMVRSSQSKYYEATVLPRNQHRENTYKAITGLTVLEIGCSDGTMATDYTKYCKSFVGVDISDQAIQKATSLNLSGAKFICTDAHKLPFEDASFDIIIVNSLLHHLDLEVSLKEISRILVKRGKLVFLEPLGTNPLFQFYRYLTPNARTVDERPFTFSDIALLQHYFEIEKINWFGFFVIFSAFSRSKMLRKILTRLDLYISRTPLKYFFWQICGFGLKRE